MTFCIICLGEGGCAACYVGNQTRAFMLAHIAYGLIDNQLYSLADIDNRYRYLYLMKMIFISLK